MNVPEGSFGCRKIDQHLTKINNVIQGSREFGTHLTQSHNLPHILDGNLDNIIDAVATSQQASELEEQLA